ncbi:hypothetical protein OPQ81_000033 [Rhizoctonia solani]|nr:hypothetical protein OPQ81_000033 [Rhizoctonia solani]
MHSNSLKAHGQILLYMNYLSTLLLLIVDVVPEQAESREHSANHKCCKVIKQTALKRQPNRRIESDEELEETCSKGSEIPACGQTATKSPTPALPNSQTKGQPHLNRQELQEQLHVQFDHHIADHTTQALQEILYKVSSNQVAPMDVENGNSEVWVLLPSPVGGGQDFISIILLIIDWHLILKRSRSEIEPSNNCLCALTMNQTLIRNLKPNLLICNHLNSQASLNSIQAHLSMTPPTLLPPFTILKSKAPHTKAVHSGSLEEHRVALTMNAQ